MNSATDAAKSGERLNLKRAERDVRALALADGAALTVVTFVVVFLADGAGFLADLRVAAAGFLVAIDIPPYRNMASV
jgi:hypothetical protein